MPWRALPRRVSKLYFAMRGMLTILFLLFKELKGGEQNQKQLEFEIDSYIHLGPNLGCSFYTHLGMPLDEPFLHSDCVC